LSDGRITVPSMSVEIPTEPAATAADDPSVIGSLSPSRAADFKACPLLYRFRTIDRFPETPSPDAVRGTVVHAVLERLFDRPAADRTVAAATQLVVPEWDALVEQEPSLADMFAGPDGSADPAALESWLDSARQLVENYFTLEDPRRIEPAAREELVEIVIDGLRLRGYVDRLDVSAGGDVRIVDYKTGTSPRESFEAKALFQMKFYALVIWRTRGIVPRQLRLMYLSDSDTLTYTPDSVELERFERTLRALWVAIQTATRNRDFRPSPSALCAWCDHHARCPAQGGTLPPFPEEVHPDAEVATVASRHPDP